MQNPLSQLFQDMHMPARLLYIVLIAWIALTGLTLIFFRFAALVAAI